MENIMTEQRMQNSDRRSWKAKPAFPLLDSTGAVITEDRRMMAERRGYNIEVISFEEIELEVIPKVTANTLA